MSAAIQQMVIEAARRHGLDERIALAQIKQESGFNPRATGPATKYGTAKGVAQFIDPTARRYGVSDAYDPAQALEGWGKYMSFLLRRYDGNYALALAAYNAGEGNVDKHKGVPPFRETQNYVRVILGNAGRAPDFTSSPSAITPTQAAVITTAVVVVVAALLT